MKRKLKHQVKSRWYYIFWGIATIAVVAGQVYVGSGYRTMSASVKELIEHATMKPTQYMQASKFINYFSNTGRIDEYLRTVKLDRIADQPQSLFGMRPEDDLFSDFDMHPEDMDIKVYPLGEKTDKILSRMNTSMRDFRLRCLMLLKLLFLENL